MVLLTSRRGLKFQQKNLKIDHFRNEILTKSYLGSVAFSTESERGEKLIKAKISKSTVAKPEGKMAKN